MHLQQQLIYSRPTSAFFKSYNAQSRNILCFCWTQIKIDRSINKAEKMPTTSHTQIYICDYVNARRRFASPTSVCDCLMSRNDLCVKAQIYSLRCEVLDGVGLRSVYVPLWFVHTRMWSMRMRHWAVQSSQEYTYFINTPEVAWQDTRSYWVFKDCW